MIVFAHWPFMSKYSPSSVIRLITSYMSYGLRLDSGSTSSSASSRRSIGSLTGRTGGRSSQFCGMYDRYALIHIDALLVACHLHVTDARLARVHARAAQFLLGDVLADGSLHEVRPRERH